MQSSRGIGPPTSFPISRDPPEGGTTCLRELVLVSYPLVFPISRDPPEGGTRV